MDADENGWGREGWRGFRNTLVKLTIREESPCSAAAFMSFQNKNYIISLFVFKSEQWNKNNYTISLR